MIDTTLLGHMTAITMDDIAEHFVDDDQTIRTVMIIVEVDSPTAGEFVIRSTDDRPWVQEAFLDEAARVIARMRDEANSPEEQ